MSPDNQNQNGIKFNQDVIKGRIAETIVEQLFISMDYEVYRFGIENTVPGLVHSLSNNTSDVAQTIRKMPDFIIKDKDGNVFFIEVKYRSKEKFSYEDLKGAYPYNDVFFIVISKDTIKCITLEELKKGDTISRTSGVLLGYRPEFKFIKGRIGEFLTFAKELFANV